MRRYQIEYHGPLRNYAFVAMWIMHHTGFIKPEKLDRIYFFMKDYPVEGTWFL